MQSIVVSNEILLERVRISDAATIFHAIDQNRSHLRAWLPFVDFTKEIKDSEAFIQTIVSRREETRNEVYTIWFKGEFSGLLGFHNTDKVNEKTEIGYWLINEMTGKGIIHRSCQMLIGLAFGKMGMNRITIRTAVGNLSSEKIASRLGFIFEGIERSGERHHDLFLDLKVFSLLKVQYEQPEFSIPETL
ncbi:MAG: GNAT family protein [Bacteroidia bacterium]|nr:GNAT family protein [Bacteroidia bacterium]